jgi:hypothetical protein
MRCALRFCILVFFLSCVSASPTSQPARLDWDQTMSQLARCVVSNNPELLPPVLSSNADFARFNGEVSAPGRLLGIPPRRTLLFCKAYNQIPDNFAGDLSDAATTWKQLDEVKTLFQIGSPLAIKAANQTAQRWMTKNLMAKPTDPMGVLVIYCQETDEANSGQILFILAKGRGEATGARVSRLVFGDPLTE